MSAAAPRGSPSCWAVVTADRRRAQAFDAAAVDYDQAWGTNPSGLIFRHVYQERLAALFPRGARALDLGCGTGDDALFLARRGVSVGAFDVSSGMLDRARAKAEAAGVSGAISFAQGPIEELAGADGCWDGACSNFGALNCADRAAVGRRLASLLRPGAPVLLCIMGRHPLPETMLRASRMRGERRHDGEARVGGVAVDVSYPSAHEVAEAFGPAFDWTRRFALGVCLPGPGQRRWVEDHPQAFGLLAMAERVVRGLPGLRALGDHFVLEGRRV